MDWKTFCSIFVIFLCMYELFIFGVHINRKYNRLQEQVIEIGDIACYNLSESYGDEVYGYRYTPEDGCILHFKE